MILTNKKGMALIAALMVAFLFLALGLALMLSVKGTLRQADTGRNNLLAYNLAEAGIADALFRLNYSSVGGNFPFTASVNPLATSGVNPAGDTIQTNLTERVIRDGGVIYTPYNGATGDYYRVTVVAVNAPPTQYKLVSEGFYKGSYKKIEVTLRGNQHVGEDRQIGVAGPQGIAEAFNKHVIYAPTVVGAPALPGVDVTGNITCVVSPAAGGTTYSGSNNSLTQVIAATVPAPIAPILALPSYVVGNLFRNGQLDNTGPNTLPPGVTYSGSTTGHGDFYTFGPLYAGVNQIDVRGASGEYDSTGTPIVGGLGYTPVGDVIINEAPISNYLRAAGTITLQDLVPADATFIKFFGANTALESGSVIVNSGITITGDLIVRGAVLTLNNVVVNGAVYSNNNITFLNVPNITVGASQTAAIFAYSTGGDVEININAGANFDPTYTRTDQAAIIAYSSFGTALININANIGNGNVAPPYNGRLIYASGITGATINLNLGVVQGCLVTDGTVHLTSGSLIYDQTSFTTAPIPPDVDDIYGSFIDGRRVYLPAIGGWK